MDDMCSVCKRECKDLFVSCHCKKLHFYCLHISYIPKEEEFHPCLLGVVRYI